MSAIPTNWKFPTNQTLTPHLAGTVGKFWVRAQGIGCFSHDPELDHLGREVTFLGELPCALGQHAGNFPGKYLNAFLGEQRAGLLCLCTARFSPFWASFPELLGESDHDAGRPHRITQAQSNRPAHTVPALRSCGPLWAVLVAWASDWAVDLHHALGRDR